MARPTINGKRVHVILTTPQLRHLEKMSRKTGLTTSDLIRRAVDADIYRATKADKK